MLLGFPLNKEQVSGSEWFCDSSRYKMRQLCQPWCLVVAWATTLETWKIGHAVRLVDGDSNCGCNTINIHGRICRKEIEGARVVFVASRESTTFQIFQPRVVYGWLPILSLSALLLHPNIKSYIKSYLVGGLEHQFYVPIHIGFMSSSQLTNSYFSERFFPNHQPEPDITIKKNPLMETTRSSHEIM